MGHDRTLFKEIAVFILEADHYVTPREVFEYFMARPGVNHFPPAEPWEIFDEILLLFEDNIITYDDEGTFIFTGKVENIAWLESAVAHYAKKIPEFVPA